MKVLCGNWWKERLKTSWEKYRESSQYANGISIGSAVFAQMTAECSYTLQWEAPFPIKIATYHGGIWTPI